MHHPPNEKGWIRRVLHEVPCSQYSEGGNSAQLETAFNRNPRRAKHVSFDVRFTPSLIEIPDLGLLLL